MPALLTQSTAMTCPHGGTVTAAPTGTTVLVGGADVVLRVSDSFVIAGCPFTLPTGAPHPCVTVQWQVTAMKVKNGGDLALNESSVGLCLAPDQVPQGTVIVSSAQPTVAGI